MQQPSEEVKSRFRTAHSELETGNPAEAIRLFEEVRKAWRDDADILYLEGLAYGKLEDIEGVIRVSKHALELAPDHFGALCNLANTLMLTGDQEGALENYGKALQSKPDAPEVLDNYGRALGMLGRREEAISHYKKALEYQQDFAPAHSSLGRAYAESGEPKAAMEKFQQALRIDPGEYHAHMGIAALHTGVGGLPAAESHYKEAIKIQKHDVQPYLGLASVESYKGDYDKALEVLAEADQLRPGNDPAIAACKADCLEHMGKLEQAYEILQELAEDDRMSPTAVIAYAKLCHKFGDCDKALDLINLSAEQPATNSMQKQSLMFAAGALLDKLGRYDESFDYYRRANEAIEMPITRDYVQTYDVMIKYFTEEAMAILPRARTGSTRPIFILGMPRSGTTLTEQILASHPDVYGAGELSDIKQLSLQIAATGSETTGDYAQDIANIDHQMMTGLANRYLEKLNELDSKARFVTDKLPHNFQHVGLINLLFPEARIIHCRRNPLDNGLSIFFQSFIWSHDYSADLAGIGEFYKEYERLMRHWEKVIDIPMMTVQYEDMIEDQEGMSRKLLEFCGLEWDPSVMEFHDSKRTVATASYAQVRQPIYKTSQARWKNYAKHLKPLKDALPAHCVLGIEGIELINSS